MMIESFSKEWCLKLFTGNDDGIVFKGMIFEIVPFKNDDGIIFKETMMKLFPKEW